MLLALSLFAVPGCVVKYGEVPQPGVQHAQAPVNYVSVESELMALRADAESADVDQRDRIDAALELIRLAETDDFNDQDVLAYLERVVDIERRLRSESVLTIDGPRVSEEVLDSEPIEEEVLGGDEDTGDPEEDDPEDTEDPEGSEDGATETSLDRAREALAEENYASALRVLERIKDEPGGAELWGEAVNGHVHAERERAGEMFLGARELPMGDARVAAIQDVLDMLKALAKAYPETDYKDALERNIGLVERALEEAKEE